MANAPFLQFVQVCNSYSLYAKRTSNRNLLLFPCPHVVCNLFDDCIDVFGMLLLCCGDVERNPGPLKKSKERTDETVEAPSKEPTIPLASDSEWQKEILQHLRDLKLQSGVLTGGQADLLKAVNEVKAAQESVESKLVAITERLTALEARTESIGTIEHALQATRESISGITTANETLRSRLDDMEDRSRRNNLVFHGLSDSNEKWNETEAKVMAAVAQYIDPSLTTDEIERAHRLSALAHTVSSGPTSNATSSTTEAEDLLSISIYLLSIYI
ncbi:uncharacterized protein LOC144143388 [Haemaphysalis longicornis]